jgi:hypothetical protein
VSTLGRAGSASFAAANVTDSSVPKWAALFSSQALPESSMVGASVTVSADHSGDGGSGCGSRVSPVSRGYIRYPVHDQNAYRCSQRRAFGSAACQRVAVARDIHDAICAQVSPRPRRARIQSLMPSSPNRARSQVTCSGRPLARTWSMTSSMASGSRRSSNRYCQNSGGEAPAAGRSTVIQQRRGRSPGAAPGTRPGLGPPRPLRRPADPGRPRGGSSRQSVYPVVLQRSSMTRHAGAPDRFPPRKLSYDINVRMWGRISWLIEKLSLTLTCQIISNYA